jgi:hypothetical protein
MIYRLGYILQSGTSNFDINQEDKNSNFSSLGKVVDSPYMRRSKPRCIYCLGKKKKNLIQLHLAAQITSSSERIYIFFTRSV